jgi:hypothetical protein
MSNTLLWIQATWSGLLYWGLRKMVESGSGGGKSLSLSCSLCEENQEGGSLAGEPGGSVDKALEIGISPHRGPVENLLEGLSTGNFEG